MGSGAEVEKASLSVIITVGLVIVHYWQLKRDLWKEGKGRELLALCFYLSFVQVLLLPLEACSLDYFTSSLSISFLTISQVSLSTVDVM